MRPFTSEFYLGNAVLCAEIARQATDADYKATWLAMAQSWLSLADQGDKSETPKSEE